MKRFTLFVFAGLIISGCFIQHSNRDLANNNVNSNKKQQRKKNSHTIQQDIDPVQNLIIITLDGFRWQEVFNGADHLLINNKEFTPEDSSWNNLYWAPTP